MALQRVPNRLVSAFDLNYGDAAAATMDAAGESCAIVGYVMLQNGPASTKTISSSGGKIYYRTNAITFANAGTNFRIGIQDVSATTGLEDNSYDVQADLVGGTATITANAYMVAAMTSGSKVLTHGQLIAVVFEMTARGGGADSVTIDRMTPTLGAAQIPYGTLDNGTLAKAIPFPWTCIETDDGTMAWILGTSLPPYGRTGTTFGNGSTPDEYCVTFTPAYTCEIDAIGVDLADLDTADTIEVILYTNPLVTPSATVTITPDNDQTDQAAAGAAYSLFYITPTTLTAGVTYGVAIRPTTANTVQIGYIDLLTGNDKVRAMGTFGTSLSLAARTDVTGAFSVVQTYYAPALYLHESKLDDGISSGGTSGFFIQ